MLPKVIYRLSLVPKYQNYILSELEKIILEFIRWHKAKAVLNRRNKVGGITITDMKTSYRVTVTKIVWCMVLT